MIAATMNDLASHALELVSRELTNTLEAARRELESYAEGHSDREALLRIADLLHLVRGALKIVEMNGAALLADEMEQMSRRLAEPTDRPRSDEGLEALTRAMVQLPAYLERLVNGGKDIALVLLPLINDLRHARGRPALSEATLMLVCGAAADRLAAAEPKPVTPIRRGFEKIAQRVRPAFQAALLGWIRGVDTQRHLDELLKISVALERAAQTDQGRQLWSVVAAVLTAIRSGGLDAAVELKRLVGQADRQLKRVIDGGEAALVHSPPVELLNDLLDYVARAECDEERVVTLKQVFGLGAKLAQEEQLERAREGFAGPSIKLMRTVAQAIKEDLGAVKDVLDIFVRTGMQDREQLGSQLAMLKKIGDTLAVLGLERARAQIQSEMRALETIVSSSQTVDRAQLERIAATLLDVEDALDRELVGVVLAPEGEPAAPEPDDVQQRHVTQAVLGECIVNLTKIKEAVVQLANHPGDARALDTVKPQLRGIVAGLLMLNKTRAMKVVERIGAVIETRLSPSTATLQPEHLERLADAIVSVEYYMETVGAGRSDPWYTLDNAERCLELLEGLPAAQVPSAPEASEPTPQSESARPEPASAATDADEQRSDPEIVALFIEEAREEIANIERHLPAWTERPDDTEALISIRRSFHTLKGSGRMVGAQLLGEFAWSLENLLNRVINQTLEATPPMLELIREAVDALPQLIEQLESGSAPKADVQLLMKRAEAFAEGDPGAASITGQSLRVPALEPETAAEASSPEMDPVLADIFVKEMRGHLAVIDEYLAGAAGGAGPVDEPLYRACHTLLGSARMAGFEPAIAVAGPLAEHLRRHFEAGTAPSAAGLDALGAAAREMRAMADALSEGRAYSATPGLAAQLEALAPAESSHPHEVGAETTERPPAVEDASAIETPVEGQTAAEPAAAVTFDPEIAGIFAEEAAEILDDAEHALQAVRQQQDRVGLTELQRLLHTLKGGARMAGVLPMGDLSHGLETLLAMLGNAAEPPSAASLDLVQRCLDRLQQMRDAIDAGRMPEPATELLAELDAGRGPAAPDALQPRAQVPAEPLVATPEPAAAAVAPQSDEAPAVEPPPAADDGVRTGELELSRESLAELEAMELQDGTTPAQQLVVAPTEPPVESDAPARLPEPQAAMATEIVNAQDGAAQSDVSAEQALVGELGPSVTSEASSEAAASPTFESLPLAASPPGPTPTPAAERRTPERAETARVDAALLDALLNGAGEISIFQSRLKQQLHSVEFHLGELGQTVARLREQLRKLEAETEAQILYRHQGDAEADSDFDPLELDRYSTIQQLSRALAETANDVASINELLHGLTNEADTLLTQQARVTAELQDGLMQTRMVPFHRHVARLARIVRQACADTSKSAELVVEGESSEIDRQVLECMLPPFEHLLRNCVVHGIEDAATRRSRGKPETGKVFIKLKREGAEVLIEVGDDGGGLDLAAIRRKAFEQGLVADPQKLSDEQAVELILKPGFSTAGELTQAAGRGVGMDVVDNEVKKLGGSMRIESTPGVGTRFVIRLPYTLAITHALIVSVGAETFALPLPTVDGITRLTRDEIRKLLAEEEPKLEYGGVTYRIQHLGGLVGAAPAALSEEESAVPLVLVRAGESSAALLTDSLEGSREIVVKTLGPHIASVPGVTGATILGDGRVVMILDVVTLVRARRSADLVVPPPAAPDQRQLAALVVDDSITMRRVTQRLLERRGVKVLTARDGLDAITVLQENEVDVILLDIEMPRMDGYQFATHVRNDPRLKHLPIIMITSRSGEKHRAKAVEIGVNDYLSKPYQESQLVAAIEALVGRQL